MSDPIKEAFQRAKADIASLHDQLASLKQQVEHLTSIITSNTYSPSSPYPKPTEKLTELSNYPLEAVKTPNKEVSTGNRGVPTNQPTNQQTNQHTGNEGVPIKANFNPTDKPQGTHTESRIEHLARVSEILASLDGLKKEVRIKFKRLTDQEMVVFAKIYELDDGGVEVTYEVLAYALSLSEISIRDYIRKIIAKGIPVEKRKENNKKILLHIPEDFKRVASLQTINQLREL